MSVTPPSRRRTVAPISHMISHLQIVFATSLQSNLDG
jgi:hypothetical protein